MLTLYLTWTLTAISRRRDGLKTFPPMLPCESRLSSLFVVHFLEPPIFFPELLHPLHERSGHTAARTNRSNCS
jgi:hypothetical protein